MQDPQEFDQVVYRENALADDIGPGRAVTDRRVRTTRVMRFPPGGVVTAIAGVTMLVIGLIAVARGGLGGSVTEPVVDVMGFNHTPLLGIIDAGGHVFGTLLGVGGIVAVAPPSSFDDTLAVEASFGWLCIIPRAIVVITNVLLPYTTRRTVVSR
jgi:hypothetical protein